MTIHFNPVLLKSKLISAILPKGIALNVIKKLRDEKRISSANINYARGTGRLTRLDYGDDIVEREKEILTVVVMEEHSEELFEYIYAQAEINQPHGGVMYMHELAQSTELIMPDVSEEAE